MPKFDGLFFIEGGKANKFMHDSGMFEPGKYLCVPYHVRFTTDKKITKRYLQELIDSCFNSRDKDRLIAIAYKGRVYAHKSAHAISDGYMFLAVNV